MSLRIFWVVLLTTSGLQARAQSDPWALWLKRSAEQNPAIVAVQHDMTAAEYSALALAKPLYNPSLNSFIEREGDEFNYQLGLSTNIDWHNVQAVQTALGKLQAQQAAIAYTNAANDLLAQIIRAQISTDITYQAYQLAEQQVDQTLQLLALARQQLAAGEVNSTDVAMAKAAVAQGIAVENERYTVWLEARQKLRTLVDNDTAEHAISPQFWQANVTALNAQQVLALPTIQGARLAWLSAVEKANVQRANNQPVPNVGVGVGQMAGEPLVSLNVSVPLQWRNDYSEASQAAQERTLASEQRLRDAMRNTRENVQASIDNLRQTLHRYQQWQQLDGNNMAAQLPVLRQRYQQGDLALADYQGQVQAIWAGMQAALNIEQNYRLAYVAYLHTTAALAPRVWALAKQGH